MHESLIGDSNLRTAERMYVLYVDRFTFLAFLIVIFCFVWKAIILFVLDDFSTVGVVMNHRELQKYGVNFFVFSEMFTVGAGILHKDIEKY